jgi:hypothetical protein
VRPAQISGSCQTGVGSPVPSRSVATSGAARMERSTLRVPSVASRTATTASCTTVDAGPSVAPSPSATTATALATPQAASTDPSSRSRAR